GTVHGRARRAPSRDWNRPRRGRELRARVSKDEPRRRAGRPARAARHARVPGMRRALDRHRGAPVAAALDLSLVRAAEPVREAAMRVLHAPAEIAGQASILARALRAAGVDAHSLAYNPGFPQYTPDEALGYDDRAPLPRYLGYVKTLLRHAGRYDVYHFHFGRTLIPPHNVDLPLYRALGARVVFHYHGCDVRNRAHMRSAHARATCTECAPFCIPERQRRILADARRFADAELVSTPDLLESAPRAIHLPVAVDLGDYPVRLPGPRPKLVLHAPTNRLIKGTRHLEGPFERLRPRFPDLRLEIVQPPPLRQFPP